MKRERNYTAGERAIIAIGAAAGKTVAEINAVLEADAKRSGGTYRAANATSVGMAGRYPTLPTSTAEAQALWEHVRHPKPLGVTALDLDGAA
jgi:hypothetical protein